MHSASRSRFRTLTSLAAPYPLTAWLTAGFLLLHTGLRALLMAQTWHAAQIEPPRVLWRLQLLRE